MGSVHEPTAGRTREVRAAPDRGMVTASHGFDVALNPATIGALMAGADRGTRERLIASLQGRHGNAAVQRLISDARLPVQRWTVSLAAGTADCGVVVNYLDANSPHRATSGWAKTNVRFSWGGDPVFSEANGVITATVANPTVTKTVSVDMPEWTPTDATMLSAWGNMTTALRAHEARHEAIATTWESTLRTNLTGLRVTVASRTLTAFNAAVQSSWNGWLGQHQAAQNAIDPYSALLDCGGGEEEGAAPGGGGGGGEISGLEGEPDLSGE